MIKVNLFRFSVLALAILFSTGANAQTKIWGAGAAVGAAEGEFQAAFSTTASTTAWEARSIQHATVPFDPNSPTFVNPGNALWVRTTAPGQGAYGAATISSPSQANGAALFDSDFMDNGGVQGTAGFGTGTAPSPHHGVLISPRIDLTGYTNQQLVVKFYCSWRNFNTNFSVGISTDDGLTWVDEDAQNFFPCVTNAVPAPDGWATAPFYTVTAGVANLTQCRIRFSFNGDYYYAMVDDVSIELAENYDLAIRAADPNGTTLGDAFTDVRVGNNAYIPCTNIHPTDLKEWFWGLSAVNNGAQTIFPTENPRARMVVDYISPGGAVTPNVYLDTMDLDTVVAGAADNITVSETLRDISFLSTYGEGTYQVTYWVEHDSADANPDNDTLRHAFNLTGDQAPYANYLSKARLSANDGRVIATRPIFPGGTDFTDFEYGSMFYFSQGMTDSIAIDSVDFRYYVPNGFTGAASQTLAVNIYQWTDGDADGAIDDAGTELLNIGTGISTATGLGSTVMPGSYGLATTTGFVNPANGLPVPAFVDGGFYVVTLQNNAAYNGVPNFNSNSTVWFGADEYNYAINAASTSAADPIPNPSPVKVIDGAAVGDWNWVGFGADMVPSIGLYLNSKAKVVINSTAAITQAEGTEFSVYPNPTVDLINVSLELDEAQDVTYILTDVSGRVLSMNKENNVTKANYTLTVTDFPAGIYFLTAKTATGESTQRFVKK